MSLVQLVDRGWAATIRAGLSRDSSSFRIVCPFIKKKVLVDLLKEHRPGDLRIVTRFNLADFAGGVSDVSALRAALAAGGHVRGVRGLHSKVFIFGSSRAAVTSANLTSGGLDGNHEFGCVSEQGAFVASCAAYFEGLWEAASPNLTYAQVDEWQSQLDRYLDHGARPDSSSVFPDFGARLWPPPEGPPDLSPPGWPAESSNWFVKFFGEGNNRHDRGFPTLEEIKRTGCHWACAYPAKKRPQAVHDGDTLFLGRFVKHPNDTMIFGRVIGLAHRPGQDEASLAEIVERPFKKNWPNYIRVHHGEFVAGNLGNGISLNELMNVLQSDSFGSTQRNASKGDGNTDPRKAFLQQAHVKLTREGASWLTVRLEEAFAMHGAIPAETLNELDWP